MAFAFHAHVYFQPWQIETAKRLRQGIARDEERLTYLSPLRLTPVGPHPTGMFELNFNIEDHEFWLKRLIEIRGELPVLIHEDTKNDYRDHTEGALWLGRRMALDFAKLDQVSVPFTAV